MPQPLNNPRELVQEVPATLALIGLSVVGFLLIYLNAPIGILSKLTFSDFQIVDNRPQFLPTTGEYWRYLTPIFLHFGWLHVTFNSLWLWELGALIERRLGTSMLLPLVLVSGSGSNLAQAYFGGEGLFGGMSGVVYALLGFCWVYNGIRPQQRLHIPRPVVMVMLGWLVFCFVAPTEMLGLGSIANAAHLSGFLLGCGTALVIALWHLFEKGMGP